MDSIQSFLPLILIFGIMYFLMIRPQQQKMKKHRAMVAALRKGDKVVTQGGVYGKVTKVLDDGKVDVEIASGVVVRVVQSTIQSVMSTDGASPAPMANLWRNLWHRPPRNPWQTPTRQSAEVAPKALKTKSKWKTFPYQRKSQLFWFVFSG